MNQRPHTKENRPGDPPTSSLLDDPRPTTLDHRADTHADSVGDQCPTDRQPTPALRNPPLNPRPQTQLATELMFGYDGQRNLAIARKERRCLSFRRATRPLLTGQIRTKPNKTEQARTLRTPFVHAKDEVLGELAARESVASDLKTFQRNLNKAEKT